MAQKIFPEEGEEASFLIPGELAKQFAKELRIVIKPGPTVGIWNPDIDTLGKLMKAGALKEYDIVLTPKKLQK